ncbi:unnamed protein product [Bursaphelenchus okinawaensis]|uniref:Uncharacterized protein n=1 Tax=Bursaphelenchus okinawaensis TaxID=465554 RepID=A0A811LPA1_9BILA|nr:unnamed protein product [Bursaphelenchus okinawaensis]CAG9127526.1 unnamed protein product [Bursaphelenchus okinawaensis]
MNRGEKSKVNFGKIYNLEDLIGGNKDDEKQDKENNIDEIARLLENIDWISPEKKERRRERVEPSNFARHVPDPIRSFQGYDELIRTSGFEDRLGEFELVRPLTAFLSVIGTKDGNDIRERKVRFSAAFGEDSVIRWHCEDFSTGEEVFCVRAERCITERVYYNSRNWEMGFTLRHTMVHLNFIQKQEFDNVAWNLRNQYHHQGHKVTIHGRS